jgi:F-type H+-transporting ATPase subunit b
MLIDWFTVGAQTLNFLILVWLMKRFLYKPILNAIDAREKRMRRNSRTPTRKRPKPRENATSSSIRTKSSTSSARHC